MMLNFGFWRKRNAIPRAGLLLYLGRPNLEAADVPLGDDTEIGDDTIIRWMFLLPADADIRAATGWVSGAGNIFYDAAGAPVAVLASEIAAAPGINQAGGLVFFKQLGDTSTETGKLLIYSQPLSGRNKLKLYRWLFPYSDTGLEILYGRVQGDLDDAIDWAAGKTMVVHFEVTEAPGVLIGGLSTTSTGLEFSDGTNTAVLETTLPAAGELVTCFLRTTENTMQLKQLPQSTDLNKIIDDNDITTANWTTSGVGTSRVSAHVLQMAAVNPSRLLSNVAAYVDLVSGQTFRLSAKIKNLSTGNNRITFGIAASTSPYEETQIGAYTKMVEGLLVAELTATRTCKVLVYFGNALGSPGTVELYDITGRIKTGNSNGLVSFGDSICQMAVDPGAFNDNLGSFTSQYANALNIPYRNRGISGERLDQIYARFAPQLGTPSTVFLEGGINNLFQASTDPNAAMQASMTSMITGCLAVGAKVIVFDIPTAATLGSKDAWRLTYNTWLAGYCTANNLDLVPLSTILCDSGGSQIAEYYTGGDMTHPNSVGHTAITNWLLENINYVGDTLGNEGNIAVFDGSMPALTKTEAVQQVQIWNGEIPSAQIASVLQGL